MARHAPAPPNLCSALSLLHRISAPPCPCSVPNLCSTDSKSTPFFRTYHCDSNHHHIMAIPRQGTDSLLCHRFEDLKMGICISRDKLARNESEPHIDFAGGKVHLVTSKENWDQKLSEAKQDGKTVVANFSASWCGPCRMVAPFYCELSEKYPSLMFLSIDVDELTDFSTSWDIKATPTFFFLKDGKQIEKLVGANKPELQAKINAVLDSHVGK